MGVTSAIFRRPALFIWCISVCAGIGATTAIFFAANTLGIDPTTLTGDSRAYVILTENIIQHGVFSLSGNEPFYPESFRSPGYPLFLALLLTGADSVQAAIFLQVLLLSIAPLLLYLLFRPLNERAAFWGSLVFAFEPLRLFYGASLLTDALFTTLLLGSLLLLNYAKNDWRYALLAGAVLGFCVLVRPIAMFLPFLYGLYLLFTSARGIQLTTVLCASAFLVILPWSLRNFVHFGSLQVSSVGTANLMIYNAPAFVAVNHSPYASEVLHTFQKEQATLPEEESLSLARSGIFLERFREVIEGEELRYLFFHVVKTAPFFLTDGLRDVVRLFGVEMAMPNLSSALFSGKVGVFTEYIRMGGPAVVLFVGGVLFWGIVTLLALYTIVIKRGKEWFFVAALVLYFALLTGPVSNGRYRLPVEGLLIVAAAAAVLPLKRNES